MLNEIYKQVEGYEGYAVSNLGNVKNSKGLIMQTYIINSGYKAIKLSDSGKSFAFLVHRLVALTHLIHIDGKDVVNHIDGDKLNNNVDNLEWVTTSENLQHALDTGLKVYNKPTLGLKIKTRDGSITSKYLGVTWDRHRSKWRAAVVFDKVKYVQKRFDSELDAAKHRDYIVTLNNLPLPLNF